MKNASYSNEWITIKIDRMVRIHSALKNAKPLYFLYVICVLLTQRTIKIQFSKTKLISTTKTRNQQINL